jgi:hypothetical protein
VQFAFMGEERKMNPDERQKAILSLSDWIQDNVRESEIKSYPKTTVGFGENAFVAAVKHARAQFLVTGDVAQDLAESAFRLAHERYLNNHPIKK